MSGIAAFCVLTKKWATMTWPFAVMIYLNNERVCLIFICQSLFPKLCHERKDRKIYGHPDK